MTYVIGLDLGTTSCKAAVLSAGGALLAKASDGYALEAAGPGRAVQEVQEVWRVAQGVLRRLGEQLSLSQAAGLCLSGTMHSLLPVTAGGRPLAPAFTWADARAAPQAAALRRETDAGALYRRTGCPLQVPYHPARLRWWREEGVLTGTAYFVSVKDWVLFQLGGVWATDWALASTTGLLDIRRRQWDEEALALAGVTAEQLPPLLAPHAVAGALTAAAAKATGLPAGLPLIAGNSDGALAQVGAGAAEPGDVAMTVGTSGAVRTVVASPCLDEAMRTWCYLLSEERWFAGGAINNGGLAVQWATEQFFRDLSGDWKQRTRQFMEAAATVPAGAGGVLALPYLAGERTPHWDADGPATLHGLRLRHTRAHVARAVLEGVAFCLADVWQVLQQGLGEERPERPVRLSGGITHNPFWVQIVADVLGMPIMPIKGADASAVGAALLGHRGLGSGDELPAGAPVVETGAVVRPDAERHARYRRQHRRFQALYRALDASA